MPSRENQHQPFLLRRGALLFFLTLVIGTEGFMVANVVARQTSEGFLAAVVPGEIIALTNSQRTGQQIGPLKESVQLDQAAQAKAQDMAAKGYFAHKGPDGKTPWDWVQASGYSFQHAGENLAVRFIDSRAVVHAWMASPTHRANILKPVYTEIGVGVANGLFQGAPATYIVQYFGAPSSASALRGSQLGAVAANANTSSIVQSFLRQVARIFGEPQFTSSVILGAVATLLLLALAFAFFMHVHIQHGHMLAQGTVVASLAVLFFLLNMSLKPAGFENQSAAATQNSSPSGAVIDDGAASTGYALFP